MYKRLKLLLTASLIELSSLSQGEFFRTVSKSVSNSCKSLFFLRLEIE